MWSSRSSAGGVRSTTSAGPESRGITRQKSETTVRSPLLGKDVRGARIASGVSGGLAGREGIGGVD